MPDCQLIPWYTLCRLTTFRIGFWPMSCWGKTLVIAAHIAQLRGVQQQSQDE